MQQREYFITMAHYNRWMNERIYDLCADMTAAEYRRDRKAFFRSIHGTLNHIMLADMLWLDRFYGRSPRRVFQSLDEEVCRDFEELRHARGTLDEEICDWVESLDDDWLAQPFNFASLVSPRPRTFLRRHALMHFFNHQTHHRGQVTTLLSQAGYDPGVTDLMWLPGMEITGAAGG